MKYLFISLLLVISSPVSAQITGRLTDAFTDEPVSNALIISGNERSYSGTDGTFSSGAAEFISIYADGYQSLNIKADTLRSMNSGIIIPLHRLNYNLSEVSVIAYNNPEKLISVAGAVSTIPVDSLQYAGYNIVSSLSVSPGLIIQEATMGTMKLTLRGIGTRYPYGTKKIKMFFDGIPLYSAEGETYFDDISPEYLSRIEIMRGPASSIYGASLGGTVILYPQRPVFGHSELSLMSSAGSFGYLKNSLTYSTSGSKGDLLASFSGIRSDGYRENSNYRRNSIILNYHHRIGDKLTGALLVSGSLVRAQIPSSIDSATFVTNPQAAAPAWLKTEGYKSPDRILSGYKLKYQPSNNLEIIRYCFRYFPCKRGKPSV